MGGIYPRASSPPPPRWEKLRRGRDTPTEPVSAVHAGDLPAVNAIFKKYTGKGGTGKKQNKGQVCWYDDKFGDDSLCCSGPPALPAVRSNLPQRTPAPPAVRSNLPQRTPALPAVRSNLSERTPCPARGTFEPSTADPCPASGTFEPSTAEPLPCPRYVRTFHSGPPAPPAVRSNLPQRTPAPPAVHSNLSERTHASPAVRSNLSQRTPALPAVRSNLPQRTPCPARGNFEPSTADPCPARGTFEPSTADPLPYPRYVRTFYSGPPTLPAVRSNLPQWTPALPAVRSNLPQGLRTVSGNAIVSNRRRIWLAHTNDTNPLRGRLLGRQWFGGLRSAADTRGNRQLETYWTHEYTAVPSRAVRSPVLFCGRANTMERPAPQIGKLTPLRHSSHSWKHISSAKPSGKHYVEILIIRTFYLLNLLLFFISLFNLSD